MLCQNYLKKSNSHEKRNERFFRKFRDLNCECEGVEVPKFGVGGIGEGKIFVMEKAKGPVSTATTSTTVSPSTRMGTTEITPSSSGGNVKRALLLLIVPFLLF